MTWADCAPGDIPTLGCIPLVFDEVVHAALYFAGILALFFIIISGIRMLTSGGDPKRVEGARKTLTFAIIGLVIILFSFFIINVISTVTGATCVNKFSITGCS